jgi:hypothetical protein
MVVAMSEREPTPLARAAGVARPRPWLVAHAAGALALAIGVVGFAVIAFSQDPMWSVPDWRHTAPLALAASAAAGVSLARREGAIAVPLAGVGLTLAAMVLGWFLLTLIVVAATAAVILILSQVM